MQTPEYSEDVDPESYPHLNLNEDGLSGDGITEGTMRGFEVKELAVDDIQIAFGVIIDTESNEKMDVCLLEFKMMTGKIRRVMIPPLIMANIFEHGDEWMKHLHEEGRCGCLNQEDEAPITPEEANDILKNLGTVEDVLKDVLNGDEDESIWR